MGELLSHVEYLSETIGPRPATTDAEERAGRYIRDVFESRGIDAETQSFDSPRTYGWAFVIYHLLTIVAAVASHWSAWAGLAIGVAVAVVMRLELDTRWGLTSLMPKGPSQNIIARHVPRAGRNERVARVVVVAHYDSARSSLAFSPGMVKNFAATFGLMKMCTYAVPVMIALRMLAGIFPAAAVIAPWAWYATLVPAAYLLVPLLINVHRELLMHFTPGANDNASGVAALLGLFERLVPEPEAAAIAAREARRAGTEGQRPLDTAAEEAPGSMLLNYSPVGAPDAAAQSWVDDDGDISWDTGVISGQTSLGLDSRKAPSRPEPVAEPAPGPSDPDDERSLRLFGAPAWKPPVSAAAGSSPAVATPDPFDDLDEGTAPFDTLAAAGPDITPEGDRLPDTSRRGREKSAPAGVDRRGVRDWLGVGSDFDARAKGKDIGSWENFDAEEDEAGWKGGSAAIEDDTDPGYATSAAARIRRKVTMNVDRELTEKEVWFVATGAEEVGTVGMKAFLAEYGHDLADAVIINLDNVGSGAVAYVTREGMAKRYESDRRLMGATRRAIREADLPVKGHEYRGLSTDATPALARGYRAMSVMAFDVNGRLPNWHWMTDTVEEVSETNLQTTVDLVAAIIKEL